MYGIETMALTQKQQEKVHICNNTKHLYKKNRESAKKRRSDLIRRTVNGGRSEGNGKKLVGSWLQLAGHVDVMDYEQLMPTKGGEQDRQCNGRNVLRYMLEERKLIGKQQQIIEGIKNI